MYEMINFEFPISAFMISSSRSDSVSGDDGEGYRFMNEDK